MSRREFYVPPAKRVKAEKFDPGSEEHQKLMWSTNKKKITGLINRTNSSNLKIIVKELLSCNLIRYKGIFASVLMKAQENSPKFTDVYVALLNILNSRISSLGKLVINRLIIQYRMSFANDNKPKCMATTMFISHLTNQGVVHEILALEILHHLLEKPTPFSIEMAITMLKECGAKLDEFTSRGLFTVFESLRNLSLEKNLDSRTQELIEQIHTIRREKFSKFPSVRPELDLVEEDDKIQHEVELTAPTRQDYHIEFNSYKYDPNWKETELKYGNLKKVLLNEGANAEDQSGEDDESDDIQNEGDKTTSESSDNKCDKKPEIDDKKNIVTMTKEQKTVDMTGTDLVNFRRQIYLVIQSSLSHDEAVHKLMKIGIQEEMLEEFCFMILDCCAQHRAYSKIYSLIASKFCDLYPRTYCPRFENLLQKYYEKIHLIQETNRLRNTANFFAHLLMTNSINWDTLSCMQLRENITSSPGRCFIKFLFEEFVKVLTLPRVKQLISDPKKATAFENLFPTDNEVDTRFSINFFTLSDLGSLTDNMRNHLLLKQEQ